MIKKNQVICGDCLKILPSLVEDFIIVTDPPFNVNYHYGQYKDKMTDNDYYEMLGEVFSYSPFVVIHYPEEIYKIAFQIGFFPEKVVSWVYNSNTVKQHRDIAFFDVKPDFTKVGQPYKNPTDKRIKKLIKQGKQARLYDWWNINQVKNVSKDKTKHPCQMPLEVMERIVGLLPKDKLIVDPFCGSGTTLLACKKLNRDFVGIDIDDSYCEISKQRLKDNK